jgi:hypothetical protein
MEIAMKKRRSLIFGLVFFIFFALIFSSCNLPAPSESSTPTQTTSTVTVTDAIAARDAALDYLHAQYGDAAPSEGLVWTEENITPEELVGSSTFLYRSGNWTVTVTAPVIAPEAVVYEVESVSETTGFHWQGMVDAFGQVTETFISTIDGSQSATSTPSSETPPPVEPSTTPAALSTYDNPEYEFRLQYPGDWVLTEGQHSVALGKDNTELIFEFRRLYESHSIGPTGTGAGDLVNKGTVTIMGQTYPRTVLVFEGADKAIYYNLISSIQIADTEFAITLLESPSEPEASLPPEIEAEADQIVSSLDVYGEMNAACTDVLKFIADVTVPDGESFLPGEAFVKTWRLRNEGTCPWSTDYALAFVEGDALGAPETIALTGDVNPGDQVDLSVNMVAPATEGTYKGEWMLRNPDGDLFGGGDEADNTIWVEIKVGEGTSDQATLPNLGEPDWRDTFSNASNWFLLDTKNTKFTVEDGQLEMKAINPGEGEEWGLANHSALTDFYLEATFITGDVCSGLDRYGILARAPDPNSGYVFGFSCDGRYRLYKWDGESYRGLQEWAYSAQILVGPDQTNRLGFWAKGSTLRLYANGKLLAEVTDGAYDEGRFGLFIGSANTEDLIVFVDEIAYWELGDD